MKKEVLVLTAAAMAMISVFAGVCVLMLGIQQQVSFGAALLSILTNVKQLGNAARVAYELATHPLTLASAGIAIAGLSLYVLNQGLKPRATPHPDAVEFDRLQRLGLEHLWR